MVVLPLLTVSCISVLFKEPLHSRLGIQWKQDREEISIVRFFEVLYFIKGTVHPKIKSYHHHCVTSTLILKQNTTKNIYFLWWVSLTVKVHNLIIVAHWHQGAWHVICHLLQNTESQHLEISRKYICIYILFSPHHSPFFSLSHALLIALELSQSGSCVSCHYWSLCPVSCYWRCVKHSWPKLMISPAVEEQPWHRLFKGTAALFLGKLSWTMS